MKPYNILYKEILEPLPFMASFLSPNLEIEWANKMFRNFSGLSNDNIKGKECFMLWKLGKACQGCPANIVIETGKTTEFELPRPNHKFWSETHGKWKVYLIPLVDNENRVTNILKIAYEITPEVQARSAIRKIENRLSQAEKIANIGHWELNLKSNELFWSNEIFNIFEIDSRQFDASYEAFLEKVHPEDRDKIDNAYTQSLKNKNNYNVEHRLLLPDGRVKYVQERGKNYHDENGNQIRTLGTIQDITDRKKIEHENDKLQKQFIQAQKMESIGRLAGGVAHDINNMSGIIIGYSELALQQLEEGDPVYEYCKIIYDAARRSTEITRQLLAYARCQTISPKVLDLNETISGILKMLSRLVGEDIDLKFIPCKSLWPVKADPSQIDQIIANLSINARDAIKDVGKITIETENISFNDDYCSTHLGFIPGEYSMISVSDDGCGIDKENLKNVFEPFFTTKGIGKGTGLGLSTVYGIVRQNNGFINLYSESGVATVFKIYLPRHMGAEKPVIKAIDKVLPKSCGETILLVEDNNDMRKICMILLDQLGYRVLSTGSPGEAVQIASDHDSKIDLLITDVVMPDMNGRVLSELLAKKYLGMKTLFISGYTANVIATRGVLHDEMFFLSKPFSQKELAFKIRDVLD